MRRRRRSSGSRFFSNCRTRLGFASTIFCSKSFARITCCLSLDRDDNSAFRRSIEAASNEDSVGLQLSALNDILFSDEDFENFPDGNEENVGFIDINSFLADIACAPPQQAHHVDRSDDVDITAQIQLGDHVETSDDVDLGKNEGQIQGGGEEDCIYTETQTVRWRAALQSNVNFCTEELSEPVVFFFVCLNFGNRNRESAAKSRERKKGYEKTLQAKCRILEGECRKLKQSLSYYSVENAALRHDLIRVKEPNPLMLHCHGGGAEPAALFKDSLQMESLPLLRDN
ncbi:hypothetical protein KI387_014386, partial [Taxus chinensis]